MSAGPCSPYLTDQDILNDPSVCGDPPPDVTGLAEMASAIMYVLTGRKYPGVCTATVRPVGRHCSDLGPSRRWAWNQTPEWRYEIALQGPVISVDEVKVNGVVVDDWYLHGDVLVREGAPWPTNQKVRLSDDEDGTFSVTYTFGAEPPALVALAAVEIAAYYANQNAAIPAFALPVGTVGVNRQGMNLQMEREAERVAAVALPTVTEAIGTYNPTGARIPPGIFPGVINWELIPVRQPSGS